MDIASLINAPALDALSNAAIAYPGGSARCVFDAAFEDPLGIAASRITARIVSGPAIAEGDAVTVTPDGGVGIAYTVREVEPDGRGMVLLFLG